MDKMTNEQVALMAAVETVKGHGASTTVMTVADKYLNWLRNKERE